MNPYLPGVNRVSWMGEAKPFVVTLALNTLGTFAPMGRRQVVERGRACGEAFKKRLLQFVEQKNRKYELVEVGDPTAFGIISIVSTKALADEIKDFPEVESVIEDRPSFGLIR